MPVPLINERPFDNAQGPSPIRGRRSFYYYGTTVTPIRGPPQANPASSTLRRSVLVEVAMA